MKGFDDATLNGILSPSSAPVGFDDATLNGIISPSSAPVAAGAHAAVLRKSESMPAGSTQCLGYDFDDKPADDDNTSVEQLVQSFLTTGFQATQVGLAVERIKELRQWRLSKVPVLESDPASIRDDAIRSRIRARIFLSFTSNQISCGQREVLRFLVKNRMVDCLVTTAGGIEEDLIKCFQPTYMGDFGLRGDELRIKGINRIGNLLVPNNNYCEFEDWVAPLISAMHDEQDAADRTWAKQVGVGTDPLPEKFAWTPSRVIHRLGKEINNPDSVLYWAAVNDIPVFCPALTDGSLGDMLYFHSYKRPGFTLDIARDVRRLNDLAVCSHCTGVIILGGGIVKHHILNANMMRDGADYSVFINTACEFDGSDSGASPDEAVSWGKIRSTAKPVKVTADASIVFPLVVAATFAKDVKAWKESTNKTVCWHADLKKTN